MNYCASGGPRFAAGASAYHAQAVRILDAADPSTQSEEQIRRKRLHFGLVFQSFNLFPQYTALENVMLAGSLLAKERPDYKQKILAGLRERDSLSFRGKSVPSKQCTGYPGCRAAAVITGRAASEP